MVLSKVGLVILLCGMASGMTERKNFSGQATPSIIDTLYLRCNFAQVEDPNSPGPVRIFPGDDTPRTFIQCVLTNCGLPPASEVITTVIERKNFSAQSTPSVIDIVYLRCNFSQTLPDPNVVGDPNEPAKVRIFPGDDTPRLFIECNLVNCELPPGSTVVKCNTSIIVPNTLLGSITVTVDGQSSSINFYGAKFWRGGAWHSADSVPNIAAQDIDTSNAQYLNLLSGIEAWRQLMVPRLKLFSMASDAKRKAWWKNDPLLKATLLILRDGAEYVERLEGLDE